MASTKKYDQKLRSLRNTGKITRTMKLVSMSKLSRAHEAQRNAKLYAETMTGLIHGVGATLESVHFPLLTPRDNPRNVLVLLITSDRGLCGSYNNALIRGVRNWIAANSSRYDKVDISVCGKKGWAALKSAHNVHKFYDNITAKPRFRDARSVSNDLIDSFRRNEYDEVYVSYNNYHSPLSQTPTFEKVLPIEPQLVEKTNGQANSYIYEPPVSKLLELLIPKYLYFRIYFALLENSAGEHGARMTAMDSASKNAVKLIDHYTTLRNRARQAAITTELVEIIAGKEALA